MKGITRTRASYIAEDRVFGRHYPFGNLRVCNCFFNKDPGYTSVEYVIWVPDADEDYLSLNGSSIFGPLGADKSLWFYSPPNLDDMEFPFLNALNDPF